MNTIDYAQAARAGNEQPLSNAINRAAENLDRCERIARQIWGALFGYQPEAVPYERKEDIIPPIIQANRIAEHLASLGDYLQEIAVRI